jgi:CMP-N-acetylneuraminic acid synthetase
MIDGKTVLAIIPARGGSKRLPGKNIKLLNGKPVIAWTIQAALKSIYIDKVIVTTDDQEFARIAKKHGADIPFIRPPELAEDTSSSVSVLQHALKKLNENNEKYDVVILLQPTSPLRRTLDIDDGFEYYSRKKAMSVVSVCPLEHPTSWCNSLPENGSLQNFLKDGVKEKRSQDIAKEYRLNGSIYIADVDYFTENNGFWGKNDIYAFIMGETESIDIDTIADFELCEYFMSKSK